MKYQKYIIIGILLFAIGVVYFKYISSPEYSIKQISKSLENNDITEFNKYVDIKYITNELLDKYIKDALDESTATSGAGRLGESIGRGLIKLMRSKLEEQFSREIQKFVEEDNSLETIDNEKLNNFYIAKKILIFKKVKNVIKKGKIAEINLEFEVSRYDTILNFKIRMRDKGNYWQLFDIAKVFELSKRLKEMEQIRTKKLKNKDVTKKLEEIRRYQRSLRNKK